jgi:hypothetical protein
MYLLLRITTQTNSHPLTNTQIYSTKRIPTHTYSISHINSQKYSPCIHKYADLRTFTYSHLLTSPQNYADLLKHPHSYSPPFKSQPKPLSLHHTKPILPPPAFRWRGDIYPSNHSFSQRLPTTLPTPKISLELPLHLLTQLAFASHHPIPLFRPHQPSSNRLKPTETNPPTRPLHFHLPYTSQLMRSRFKIIKIWH